MARVSQRHPTVLDLFAGCGGLSFGFKIAGFRVAAAVEYWKPAAESFRRNHPDTCLFEGDIATVKEDLYARYAPGDFNAVVGGPPCQGYSVAGNRNVNDPRGQMYEHFIDIVRHFRPQWFVMENVKGLLSMHHLNPNLKDQTRLQVTCQRIAQFKDLKRYGAQRQLAAEEASIYADLKATIRHDKRELERYLVPLSSIIYKLIENIGYHAEHRVLNAADYGVPQRRERVFFIGTRDPSQNAGIFPSPSHSAPEFLLQLPAPGCPPLQPWRSVQDAIGDLENAPENREASHIFMRHKAAFVERLRAVPPGSTVFANYKDAWYRLRPDEPARTVKENHGGVFVHYKEPRCLTPRELARLQSFPDDFHFAGSKSDVLKQIGNAVPPELARAVASQIYQALSVTSVREYVPESKALV